MPPAREIAAELETKVKMIGRSDPEAVRVWVGRASRSHPRWLVAVANPKVS
jgi:hypothetical protein